MKPKKLPRKQESNSWKQRRLNERPNKSVLKPKRLRGSPRKSDSRLRKLRDSKLSNKRKKTGSERKLKITKLPRMRDSDLRLKLSS